MFPVLLAVGLLVAIDATSGIVVWLVRPTELAAALPTHHEIVPHPYKSYMLSPGRVYYKTGEHTTDIAGLHMDWGLFPRGTRVNAFGHQVLDEEAEHLASSKPAGEYRILFLGGSTTFLPWPFLVPEALKVLGVTRDIKVISAGTGGYTSQENLIDLAICGLSYQPDLVVAYLPVNDIGQAAHYPHFLRDYTHVRIPLSVIRTSEPPSRAIRRFPFTLRLFDTLAYNRAMADYITNANLLYHTTRQPDPMGSGHVIDAGDFEATVDAVVDNAFDMDALCRARRIPFVLLSQKMFKVDHPYTAAIYQRTLECGERLMAADRLRDVSKWNMQTLLPDVWDRPSMDLVTTTFPDHVVNFQQPLAYDDMHFTPGGNELFAARVAALLSSFVGPRPSEDGAAPAPSPIRGGDEAGRGRR